ncbi:MAG: DUF1294 domain-containing protein [Pseudomonadales bacterium]|nr:DUF1294 domain-containing protein [Pseudomonadales bacterium]NRA14645.1 DUF1294 domain-containing protein [Oceanospirillaceae bacterium]
MKKLALLITLTFCLLLSYSIYLQQIPEVIGLIYLCVSVLTYVLYGIDKSAAKKGQWRIKEASLQICSLLGGWPGAVIAQVMLRHKSRKLRFQIVFWLTLAVNLTLFIFYYDDRVRPFLFL